MLIRAPVENRTQSRRCTGPLHGPIVLQGRNQSTHRAGDGDRTRLYQLGTLTPHRAASSAKSPESRFSAALRTASTSSFCRQLTIGRATRAPLRRRLVKVSGFEPLTSRSQSERSIQTELHLENFPVQNAIRSEDGSCRFFCK